MSVILHLLHEGLLHVEQKAERLAERVLRASLVAIMIILACLNPTVGVILMWGAILRYVPVALTRRAQERILTDAHRWGGASDSANAAQVAFRAAQMRIQELERDLIIARQAAERSGSVKINPIYHAVG